MRRFIGICGLACAIVWTGSVGAQTSEKNEGSPNVMTLATGAASPEASIDQVAWIAGHWVGEAMQGRFEETWNPPSAGTMCGMFKFIKNDAVGFYEIQSIAPKGSSLVVRIKHFSPDLVGWEERDESVEFPLVKITETEAFFSGITYRRVGDDEMHIFVVIGDGEKAKEVPFVCRRAPRD